jgi:hypothetical protein
VPSNIQYLGNFDVGELFKLLHAKLAKLEKLTGQDNNSQPLSQVRVSMRVTHVRTCLRHLQGLDPEVMGEFQVGLDSLDSRLDSVERLLSSVCEDEEVSCVHLEQDGEGDHVVNGDNVDFRSGLGSACRQDGSLTTAVSASDEVAAQSMDEPRRQDMVPALFNSLRFRHVSHPVEFLLKRLRRIDRIDVNHLLTLLADIMRICSVCQVPVRQLFELIFPFCEDTLGTRVSLAMNNGWSFVQFHHDCLSYFIPRHLYEQLWQERHHRLQAKGE